MNTIFPCLGSLIMNKTDIEQLKKYYDSMQLQNNDVSSIITENNCFIYFNDNCELILNKVTPLTVSKLKNILGISSTTKTNSPSSQATVQQPKETEELINDDSIFSNPFFTTLKQIN